MTDDLTGDLRDLHAHLEATQHLPVETTASRWIGEAEAVSRDLAEAEELPDDVVVERLGHVRDLLAEVGDTEHPEADAHVAEARRLAYELLAQENPP